MQHMKLAAALIAAAALLSGCAGPEATSANPYPPVPPLQAETIPNPPVTATPLLWQPGHWSWTGAGYVWNPGRYVPRDGHGNLFMPGYWKQTPTGYVWEHAHWL